MLLLSSPGCVKVTGPWLEGESKAYQGWALERGLERQGAWPPYYLAQLDLRVAKLVCREMLLHAAEVAENNGYLNSSR